ncbi:hypothetical protein AGMMS49938_15330 [Fibrobacterales bacterium]|nr:hypothetical protein AGMMS49938_15330 [Fibrobacterales bacterium]
MPNLDKCKKLILEIAEVGSQNPNPPLINDLFPFRHYFDDKGNLMQKKLSEIDGLWTRREILTRFLFLQAVLDQGPDIEGIRKLLKDVTNNLYKKEVRILHRPLDFFKEVGFSVDEILQNHETIKKLRAEDWARENKSTANRYNLFMDNAKQVLGYAVYRWGVPLAVPYLLEKDLQKNNQTSTEPLVDFIESFESSEIMSEQIKDNVRYGLGKAIGDKAAHLFAKWFVYTFNLGRKNYNSWGNLSYELPFDSNVGRVLFRTGYLLELTNLNDLESWQVIQKNAGKGGKHYIRVTNLRGQKVDIGDENFKKNYDDIAMNFLHTKKRSPKNIEIQQTVNALLLNSQYGIGQLDDGIIHIGTNFCRNHDAPLCKNCPLKNLCEGYNNKNELIDEYRT